MRLMELGPWQLRSPLVRRYRLVGLYWRPTCLLYGALCRRPFILRPLDRFPGWFRLAIILDPLERGILGRRRWNSCSFILRPVMISSDFFTNPWFVNKEMIWSVRRLLFFQTVFLMLRRPRPFTLWSGILGHFFGPFSMKPRILRGQFFGVLRPFYWKTWRPISLGLLWPFPSNPNGACIRHHSTASALILWPM